MLFEIGGQGFLAHIRGIFGAQEAQGGVPLILGVDDARCAERHGAFIGHGQAGGPILRVEDGGQAYTAVVHQVVQLLSLGGAVEINRIAGQSEAQGNAVGQTVPAGGGQDTVIRLHQNFPRLVVACLSSDIPHTAHGRRLLSRRGSKSRAISVFSISIIHGKRKKYKVVSGDFWMRRKEKRKTVIYLTKGLAFWKIYAILIL